MSLLYCFTFLSILHLQNYLYPYVYSVHSFISIIALLWNYLLIMYLL